MDPPHPYDKNQFKSFNKWLIGVVDNTMPIELGVGLGDISWFLDLKTLKKWIDGKVRIHISYINVFVNANKYFYWQPLWKIYF